MRVLALEASTTSAKAMVFDSVEGVVAIESSPYPASVASKGYQDAVGVYEELLRLGNKVAAGTDIAAVALCSSWHSVAVANRALEPITKLYTWENTEAAQLSKKMRQDADLLDRLYRTTGCVPNAAYPRQILLYLQQQGLDLKGRCIVSQGAYCFYQMTGEFMETINIQSGGGYLNLQSLQYDPFVLELLGIGEQQLGDLATYRDTAPLNEKAARRLGVKAGIPVVPAHSDGACSQIGSFCEAPNRMTLSVGTSGAIRLLQNRPVFSAGHETWSYYGVSNYICGAAVSGATNCIDWFRQAFFLESLAYQSLEDEGKDKPDTPLFMPFLYGERCPGWQDDRPAGFMEVKPHHGLTDFYRAIQEGVLFSLYSCYQPLVQVGGEPESIVVSGGILNSKRWTQMLANVFERPILCVQNTNASTVGASVLALHAAGAYPDITAYRTEYDTATEVLPEESTVEYYQSQYARYRECYEKTSPAALW